MQSDLPSAAVQIYPTGAPFEAWPFTRGFPFPRGAVVDPAKLCMYVGGEPIPTQVRELVRWPDGSIKWLLIDFQADVSAHQTATLKLAPVTGAVPAHHSPIHLREDTKRIAVSTGPLDFSIRKDRFSFIDEAWSNGRQVIARGTGDSHIIIREARLEPDGGRRVYGLGGGICKASLGVDEYRAAIEEAGPLRTVIRLDGAYEADYPMGNYAPYRPMKFTVRIHAYAGKPWLRVLHTITFTGNARETEIAEIAVRVPFVLEHEGASFTVSGDTEMHDLTRPLGQGQGLLLSQASDFYYQVSERQGERSRRVAEGVRAAGYASVQDQRGSAGVALRHMAEEYPKALGIDGSGGSIDVYLWREPAGKTFSFRRYEETVHWELGESVYADGTGAAKTHEYFVAFDAPAALPRLLRQPVPSMDPASSASAGVLGRFLQRDREAFPRTEDLFDRYVEWVTWNIENGHWYGCFNYGDYMITFDKETGRWKLVGRWSWNNSEFDPRHGLWIQYLRTGDPALFQLAEAGTRHSTDVDTCHFNPLRPYTVGGSFRHSVDHWGDEPCPSHTFIDNWVDHYCLTADGRTLDVIREAGEYFLRVRWTDDPRLTFSLRGMANNLRGLCHLFELTREERFLEKARELFVAFLSGQNSDGSWNKRFQVSTPDRLGHQSPFGMASEGTVLAVEMDHVDQFTQDELVKLFGESQRLHKIVSPHELLFSGYQMHYLLPALEIYHDLTGDLRARESFVRCVDWFCGWNAADEKRFISERYYGMLGRSLATAYEYTLDKKYLRTGWELLQFILSDETPNPDQRVKGTRNSSAMTVSLVFWGLPRLLEALKNAGITEASQLRGE